MKPAVARRGASKAEMPAQGASAGKLNPVLPPRTFTPGKPIPAVSQAQRVEGQDAGDRTPRAAEALPDTNPSSRRALAVSDDFHSAGAGDATVLADGSFGDEHSSGPSPTLHQTMDEDRPLGATYSRTHQMPELQPKQKRAVWPWIALTVGALLGLGVYYARFKGWL